MYFHYRKSGKRIAPYCLNDIFMPSLNNYNTRSEVTLDIPHCRTKKDKKYVISWFKDLQYVKLKHKSSCNYSFFHTQFEKINFRKFAVAINFIDFY